jgi:hypothetical protein
VDFRKEKIPAMPGILKYHGSTLAYYFGGAWVSFEPLAGQLPVPRPMAWTSIEALGLPVSFTSPLTCTASPTWDASVEALALGGRLSLKAVPALSVIVIVRSGASQATLGHRRVRCLALRAGLIGAARSRWLSLPRAWRLRTGGESPAHCSVWGTAGLVVPPPQASVASVNRVISNTVFIETSTEFRAVARSRLKGRCTCVAAPPDQSNYWVFNANRNVMR